MAKTLGYSGTPLAKKLGIKPGFKIRLVNQPDYYLELFSELPANINVLEDKKIKKDLHPLLYQKCISTECRYKTASPGNRRAWHDMGFMA